MQTPAKKMKSRNLITTLLLAALAGCSKPESPANTPVPTPGRTSAVPILPPASSPPSGGLVDWEKTRPSDLIESLKQSPDSARTIWAVPKNWIQEKDLPGLIALLDSAEPCAPTVAAESSALPPIKRSTVGQEAAFLIEGFRRGRYPPDLDSSRFHPDKADIRKWWNTMVPVKP